jgi:hypothetical protein
MSQDSHDMELIPRRWLSLHGESVLTHGGALGML